MKRLVAICCSTLLSITAYAGETAGSVAVEAYSDFVTFDMLTEGYDMQVTVAGPNGYRNSTEHLSDQIAFLEIRDANGTNLVDGLYRYKVTPLPKQRWTREESSALRASGNAPEVQPIVGTSGTFRVLNGQIVSPYTEEQQPAPDARIEK